VRHPNQHSKLADTEFIHRLMQEPLLDKEKEIELATAWRDGKDEKALHTLIQSFSRLVVSIAVRFRFYGIPLIDLIQEGNVGLIIAADKFDPSRDVRFSSYAKWWIKASIQDYILKNWSIVRNSATTAQKQLFFNLKRLQSNLANMANEHLEQSELESIAQTLNVALRDVVEMEKRLSMGNDLSLSAPINDSLNIEWQDFIPDESPSPEILATQAHDDTWRKYWLGFAIDTLNEREAFVIESRRLSENPKTLEQIGVELGVSKERVRQIEGRALRKMRQALIHYIGDVKELF